MECNCKEVCQYDCAKAGQCKARIMKAFRENLVLEKDKEVYYKEKVKGE